jgi:N-methylhydantoinase B
MVGTWGARASLDGVEGISNPAANLSNNPVELIEAELPLQVTEYSFVTDSGGPGKRRGGLAFSRTYRLLADNAQCTMRADRRDHPPYGLRGGEPGGGSLNVLNPGEPRERKLPTMPMASIPLRKGDVFQHISAGGGGFGSAFDREAELVLEDVREGKVSLAAARERYGVVIDPASMRVDTEATRIRRSTMREAAE